MQASVIDGDDVRRITEPEVGSAEVQFPVTPYFVQNQ
jgi:hypothetical protein